MLVVDYGLRPLGALCEYWTFICTFVCLSHLTYHSALGFGFVENSHRSSTQVDSVSIHLQDIRYQFCIQ